MKLKYKIKILLLRFEILSIQLISKKKAAAKAFEIFCTPFLSKPYPLNLFSSTPKVIEILYDEKIVKTYNWNQTAPKKVLIVHGFNSAANKFDHIVQRYLHIGYSVTTIDAPAHGNSGGKILQTEIYKDIIDLVEQKSGPFDYYIGHSMGGLALCIYLSEKKYNTIKKLILIAPATNTKQIITDFSNRLKLNLPLQNEIFEYIKKFSGKSIDCFHIKNNLPTNTTPILWIHDYDDRITPINDVLAIQNNHPLNIEFYLTHQLGHNKIYRNETIVDKILHFTN